MRRNKREFILIDGILYQANNLGTNWFVLDDNYLFLGLLSAIRYTSVELFRNDYLRSESESYSKLKNPSTQLVKRHEEIIRESGLWGKGDYFVINAGRYEQVFTCDKGLLSRVVIKFNGAEVISVENKLLENVPGHVLSAILEIKASR